MSKYRNRDPSLVWGYGIYYKGKYRSRRNGIQTKEYVAWRGMLKRCYYEKYHIKHPTYKDCIVCEEWLDFQNFAEWFNKNYYEVDDERMCVDKDILFKDNKIYSPETCLIVPLGINNAILERYEKKAEYATGVRPNSNGKKFVARLNKFGNGYVHIGTYNTVEDAHIAYINAKNEHIKDVANYYKDKIPSILYDKILNWKFEREV